MFPVYELYNKVLDTELVRQRLSNLTSKLLCWEDPHELCALV